MRPTASGTTIRATTGNACAAGAFFLVTGQVEDLIFYACAAAMLAASAIELVIMNRAHNEYASRPVPFFEERKEEAV